MSRWPVEVRFAGIGGQGLVTMGAVLADAAAGQGLEVAASQSYGSQARGGATHADVIISEGMIDFPHVIDPDLLVVLAQEAYDHYAPGLGREARLFYDDFFVNSTRRLAAEQVPVAATATAVERLENRLAANFVMLGAVLEATGVVSLEAVREAIGRVVRRRFQGLNLRALELGRQLGRRVPGAS